MEQEAGNQMLTVLNSIENEYTALRNRFIELVQNNKGKDTSSELKSTWFCSNNIWQKSRMLELYLVVGNTLTISIP